MGSRVESFTRIGDIIEVTGTVNGERKTVRRNVLDYDQMLPEDRKKLFSDILGIPETTVIPTTFRQKLKALFTHRF